MAGYRLAPKAARLRRSPWQRRRLTFPAPPAGQSVSVGTAFETDTAVALLYVPQSIAVGTAMEADVAGSVPATGTNAGQGGLVWLWQVGIPVQVVAVGTARETDVGVAVTVFSSLQVITVGTAREADRAFALSGSPGSVVVERRHRAYRYRRRGGEW